MPIHHQHSLDHELFQIFDKDISFLDFEYYCYYNENSKYYNSISNYYYYSITIAISILMTIAITIPITNNVELQLQLQLQLQRLCKVSNYYLFFIQIIILYILNNLIIIIDKDFM